MRHIMEVMQDLEAVTNAIAADHSAGYNTDDAEAHADELFAEIEQYSADELLAATLYRASRRRGRPVARKQ